MASQPSATTDWDNLDCSQRESSGNPFVFLVGTPRSGTTLLKRMVNAHPMIAITRETHWIPRYCEKRRGVTSEGQITSRIVDKLFEHHRFDQMKMSREKLSRFVEQNPGITYASLVSHIFDNYGRRKKKPLVGDKTPTYVRKLPTLFSLWPRMKVVHLVRDGRDVCLSMLKWRMAHKAAGQFSTWKIDPVVTTAFWWKALVTVGRQDGAELLGSNYLEIAFESLVEHPGQECRRLASFLNVPYHTDMEEYYVGRTKDDLGLSTNAAWLPPTPGRRKWRDQMDRDDQMKFQAAAGDLLQSLGYESGIVDIPLDVRHQVAELRKQFRMEALERNWRLPETW